MHSKNRRGRAAALNMVITETGAGKAVAKALPALKGKLTSNEIRVPVPNGSLATLHLKLGSEITTDAVNAIMKHNALEEALVEQIQYSLDAELVSSDIIGTTAPSIFDSKNTYGCAPQITGRIQHFISRKAMDIDGLGGETLDLLRKEGLIENYADLYDLQVAQVIPLERMAEKSAQNMIDGIKKSKEIPFEKVLFALGIRFVGETVAKKLAKHFKSIDNLMTANLEALIAVDEIGDRIAESILEFSNDIGNMQLINRLQYHGVQLQVSEEDLLGQTDKLQGKVFVVSGVFYKMTRNELKKAIEDNGGKVSAGISKKTTYVVAGDKMGPSKKTKAEDLGVAIINEDDFIEMIQ
jgi:DNA ligase (NAD+)